MVEYQKFTDEPRSNRNMPAEIAGAICEIMAEAKQLGYDDTNKNSGYDFVSIDKFLASFRPLCAKHGLIIMLDEAGCDFRPGPANREVVFRPTPSSNTRSG